MSITARSCAIRRTVVALAQGDNRDRHRLREPAGGAGPGHRGLGRRGAGAAAHPRPLGVDVGLELGEIQMPPPPLPCLVDGLVFGPAVRAGVHPLWQMFADQASCRLHAFRGRSPHQRSRGAGCRKTSGLPRWLNGQTDTHRLADQPRVQTPLQPVLLAIDHLTGDGVLIAQALSTASDGVASDILGLASQQCQRPPEARQRGPGRPAHREDPGRARV